jgi:phosphatidylinositol alpha-mannosyltransferase
MPKDRKLKVGLVFDDSLDSTDGVAQYVKTVGSWLTSQGHEAVYLVGQTQIDNWDGGKVYSLSRNICVKFNGNRLSMPLLPRVNLIDKVLKKQNFDVLHVMLPCSPLMAGRVVAAADKQTAIVGTFHIFPSGRLSSYGSRLLRLLLYPTLHRFDSIVSVSQPALEFARQAYGIQSTILPNPVNVNTFAKKQKTQSKDKRIVFLGRLVPRKGCRQLIDAFALLSKQHDDARLEIAGSGPQAATLKKMVSDKGLEEKVKFLGYIDEKEKPNLLASATIACFPSLYGESFGIVLIEAMAAGAVVLGGDNPGYRSVLNDQPVLLVDPNDTVKFADRLDQLLTDVKLRKQVLSWQSRAVRRYDIGTVGAQIVSEYISSIAKAGKKSHN